jgi:chromosome partitioning protein
VTSDPYEESSRPVIPDHGERDGGDTDPAAAESDDRPAPSMLQRAIDGPGSHQRPLPVDPDLEAAIENVAGRPGTAEATMAPEHTPQYSPPVDATIADPALPASPAGTHAPEASVDAAATPDTDGAIDDGPARAPLLSLDDLLGTKHPGAARALPRVLAVANQKGGVGKTTTTINLAACLADMGYRVLVVDLDPQANATTGLGIDPRSIENSMYDVILHGVPMQDCALPTDIPTLRIAPSSLDLAGAEIELVPAFNRERKVLLALEPMLADLDYVFIDCPPSLGLLTVNALTAASEVLVPIQCEYYALEGLGQLLRNVELVQRNLNQELEVSTIALVMFDARTKLSTQVVDEVRAHFGDKVCQQIVPRSVRLSEAPSFGQPIILFDDRSRGALAYRQLAKEVSGGPPNRSR